MIPIIVWILIGMLSAIFMFSVGVLYGITVQERRDTIVLRNIEDHYQKKMKQPKVPEVVDNGDFDREKDQKIEEMMCEPESRKNIFDEVRDHLEEIAANTPESTTWGDLFDRRGQGC